MGSSCCYLSYIPTEVWARVVMNAYTSHPNDLTFLCKILQTYCTPLPSSHKKVQFVDKPYTSSTTTQVLQLPVWEGFVVATEIERGVVRIAIMMEVVP